MRIALLFCLLLAAPATATDAGTRVDAGPAPTFCGALDERGACFGDVAAYCTAPNPDGAEASAPTAQVDCAALPAGGGPVAGRCLESSGLGALCAVGPGVPCAFASAAGLFQVACLNEGGAFDENVACDLERGCQPGAAACDGAAPVACDGARLVLGCAFFGQRRELDCGALGGTCQGGRCEALGEDAPCDEESLTCAGDLVCLGAGRGVLGKCAPRGSPAVPVPPPDAGPPPVPPAPGCHAAPTATLGLLSLVALGLRRRAPRSSDR